ncbi:hypothetical protein CFP75_23755 [Amycolatopsis alba DSM 44262]|uniref:Uncharacterized protein n=1 Tax=Amycolatopsis alba DSM 44262 TaxID=1125972 RepID=A0A229RLI1_AMYAL|nr:hypothetical protein CFP75_23755 [Amycolatopsis alba DSM 44262]
MTTARYSLAPNGLLLRREQLSPTDQHPSIELVRAKEFSLPVTYDSHTARDTAAQLLGYAWQFYTQQSLPPSLPVDLLDPTNHNATTSTWSLGTGLALHYDAPFDATLDTENYTWELTPALATRWGRALLTLAAVLDDAHAVATHAVLANRSGTTTVDNLRDWTNRKIEDDAQNSYYPVLRELKEALDQEDVSVRQQTLIAALDIANPDLPATLTGLRLNADETLTHLDAAKAIRTIANRYGIPLFMWTEEHWWLAKHLSVGELTEAEWRRFTNTPEIQEFPRHVEQRQADGVGIDFELALKQAGLACRECSFRIRGEITDTYGHCTTCLPTDRTTALTEALERGCPAEPFDRGIASHSGAPGEACYVCGLPLPTPSRCSGEQH